MVTSSKLKAALQLLLYSLLGAAALYALFASTGCVYGAREIASLSAENQRLKTQRSAYLSSRVAGRSGVNANSTPTPGVSLSPLILDKLDELLAASEHDREHTEAEHASEPTEEILTDEGTALLKLLGLSTGGLGGVSAAAWFGFQYGRRRNGKPE